MCKENSITSEYKKNIVCKLNTDAARYDRNERWKRMGFRNILCIYDYCKTFAFVNLF